MRWPSTGQGAYAPVAGITPLCEAIPKYDRHYFDADADPSRICVGPGTELIYDLLETLHGTVILPTPAWLGYLPQIRFLRKDHHMLPAESDHKISPEGLERLALRLQDRQKILILNNPNNPAGPVYERGDLEGIARVCRRHNIVVISGEIYAQTTYDFGRFVSMAKTYQEGAFVTNGLKPHAAGGYRLGHASPAARHQDEKTAQKDPGHRIRRGVYPDTARRRCRI